VSIHAALTHITHYRYDRLVTLSPQQVRLRPAPHCRTPIVSYTMQAEPEGHFVHWQQDPQSNYLARLTFPDKVRELKITVNLVAELSVYNPFDFFVEESAEFFPFAYTEWQARELRPFLEREAVTPLFTKYLATIPTTRTRTVDFLVDLNRVLRDHIGYVIRLDPGVQTTEETLQRRSGSCRDSTWLLVQLLRHLGIAARFVSGYLIQLVPDVRSLDGPSGPAQDFTDLHAWCEAYIPGAGWVGLDPTSGLLAGEGHIPLSCTPDPASAAPVSGAVDDCEVEFAHHMEVHRIYESPRVTKPYSDAQWGAITSMGRGVDDELRRLDVRLTMGGEPTFVAIDDRDADEWNTTAVGPTKRLRAADLLWRLRRHYAPTGVVHFGQGKWYPGEQLPRWALSCYWRKDGQPAWSDASLYADERKNYGYGSKEAEHFLRTLAGTLGVPDDHLAPGYEDTFYYLWRERRLPINVDPFDARLEDELERERLRRIFSAGLDAVVGHALPLARGANGLWRTGPWHLRGERLYLLPGDSAMGYRLPLESLPWVTAIDYPYLREHDPFEQRPPLPGFDGVARPLSSLDVARDDKPRPTGGVVRSALCAEVRNGVLYVFLPPVPDAADYLELAAAIESTAARLEMPVLIEGYQPPYDPRLEELHITPDPGVIEVNVQPATTWDQLVEQTTTLYEEARQSRLTTDKFMIDGRHVGTGGGNHMVLGGETPADSPFLRRPDLLRSLLAYWHNHPSLSYLLSGLFIGPTSQAPRVDEARHDSVYELEIAFAQIPGVGPAEARPHDERGVRLQADQTPPWLVDRVFRHLLTDVTGNTHRAEFCIDKLYSPDSASGRRGLLEMRAFEMPPHSRMSLAQQLLLRSLVARFWRTPYEAGLTRWGTELHDRFMLPWFVRQDFSDVVDELGRAGFPLDPEWFAPHFEFRFPLYGEVAVLGTHLKLRQALEPWHVLGEEGMVGTTVRFVDSSVERLEVHVTGLTPDRYAVTCNGRTLPLQPTGRNGEYVAGVRYRAWQPPSALHPTIPVHAPLTFDIVDTWLERSLGGCGYHVMHPGGRHYDQFPVNSYEAESRRLSRFSRIAHTPGVVRVEPASPSREFPYTLDLRTAGLRSLSGGG
jgi:uncharacterized protein (DUF2126 family)/transglutaminase-like putative cysteine protease